MGDAKLIRLRCPESSVMRTAQLFAAKLGYSQSPRQLMVSAASTNFFHFRPLLSLLPLDITSISR